MADNILPNQAGQQSAIGGRRSALGRRRSQPAFAALVLVAYLCLAIATTHPLWLHLADAVPGDIGDPLLNTWILAWDAHALLADPLGLFDANIFYPLSNTLAYSEHLFSTAALILPLGLASGEPVLAHNLSLLLSFPLAGLGMYLLVLRWTQRRAAAFLAGLAFAFTPYRLAAITHLQLLTIQWLPFSLLALEGMFKYQISTHPQVPLGDRSPPGNTKYQIANDKFQIARSGGLFIIFTTLQVLASWYLAVFTMLVLGVYTLGWLIAHRSRFTLPAARSPLHAARFPILPLAYLLVAVLMVTGLTLPFALPYLGVLPDLQTARPASLAASFAAWPADFMAAAPHLRIPGSLAQRLGERPGFTEENTLFLGLVAPLLALAGVALARPRWRSITLAVILAVSLALTFAAPYQALTRLLPALSVVRVPPRWVIPATFALAALAGLGVARMQSSRRPTTDDSHSGPLGRRPTPEHRPRVTLSRLPSTLAYPPACPTQSRGQAVYCLLFSLLLIAESFAAPLPLAQVGSVADLPPVYHALRQEVVQDTGDWGVVELPMHVAPEPEFPETKRMLASTLGWWGLVNGYSGLTPARQMALRQALADFPDPDALQSLRELGGLGVRYLVVHPGELPFERARWEAAERWLVERQTRLVPVGRFGPDDLYLVNPYGDRLITDPAAVTDPYWSTHAPTRVDVRFTLPISNGEIFLLAYLIRSEDGGLPQGSASLPTFQPSNHPTDMRLTFYWQTSAPVQTDYTVFVHSLDAAGVLIGQADGPPLTNHYPTTAWQPGEIVQDSRPVPPGEHFLVGLYDPLTGQRLPAFAADGTRLPDDALRLYLFTPDQR